MNLETLTAQHAAVATARAFNGDRSTHGYSPETEQAMIADRRAALTAQALNAYRATAAQTVADAFRNAETRRTQVDAAWTNPTDTDAGTVLNRRHRWERIDARVNSGDSLARIIADADPADLAAIGEWGTSSAAVDALTRAGGLAGIVTGEQPERAVFDLITARMAELHPDGEHAATVAAARTALTADTYARRDPDATGSMHVELERAQITDASPAQVLAAFHRAALAHHDTRPTDSEDQQ